MTHGFVLPHQDLSPVAYHVLTIPAKTLRVTPAMEAVIADHVWSIEEIARLVPEPVAKKRGTYNKSINVLK